MAADLDFKALRKRLEEHGWTLARISGSHHVFTRPGCQPISIPVHRGKVKAVYGRKVDKAIEQFGEPEEQE